MAPISELLELICHPLSVRPSVRPPARPSLLLLWPTMPSSDISYFHSAEYKDWAPDEVLSAWVAGPISIGCSRLAGWRFIMKVHLHFAFGGRKRRQEFIYAKLFIKIQLTYLHERFYVLTAMRGSVTQHATQHYIPQVTNLIDFLSIYVLTGQLNTNTETQFT